MVKSWPVIVLLLLVFGVLIGLYFDNRSLITVDPGDGRLAQVPAAPSGPLPSSQTRPYPAAGADRLAVGNRYSGLNELVAVQQRAGFLRLGYFGNHWPARVIDVQTDENEMRFVRQDGTPHHYRGFDGYRMQMVRLLAAGGRETIVVFRSVQKR